MMLFSIWLAAGTSRAHSPRRRAIYSQCWDGRGGWGHFGSVSAAQRHAISSLPSRPCQHSFSGAMQGTSHSSGSSQEVRGWGLISISGVALEPSP